MSSNNNLFLTKAYLQNYHKEKTLQLALQQGYKEIGLYQFDEGGNLIYEEDGVTPKLKSGTIVEGINDKLSKHDNLKWNPNDFQYN